ncbi:MAG: hypothetical protein V1731_02165 [Candidatus Aenigmatarchaeota archaeon]
MKKHPDFTREEQEIINKCDTPEKVQDWLLYSTQYNYETDGKKTLRSFRRVVRDKTAHCLESALTAAAILSQHGYPPKIVCLEDPKMDHNIFVYKTDDEKIGSVSNSRSLDGYGRNPSYRTTRELVNSYNGSFIDELRGWTILDLRKFDRDWVTSERDLWFVERALYAAKYHAIVPNNGKRMYISPNEDGKGVIWV